MPVRDIEQSIWFESPRQSLAGNCFMKKLTTEEFIQRSTEIHGNKYCYDNVMYINDRYKVEIICSQHGPFWQQPSIHLSGQGCRLCGHERRVAATLKSRKDSFVNKSIDVHSGKYDYSMVEYAGLYRRVKIICNLHGVFEQTPKQHLNGHGCWECGKEKMGKNKLSNPHDKRRHVYIDNFFKKAVILHGDKYDYTHVIYRTSKDKVEIICYKHGSFYQTPNSHLRGRGCPLCGAENSPLSKMKKIDEFIRDAKLVHGNKYDYSVSAYYGNDKPIEIICPLHGVFKQLPHNHLEGCGCHRCKSSISENKIANILSSIGVEFSREKKFPSCRIKLPMKFDFYIPSLNILIEYHGQQHFYPIEWFGGLKTLMGVKRNDEYKKNWAIKNGFIFREYGYMDTWSFIEKNIRETIKECQCSVS